MPLPRLSEYPPGCVLVTVGDDSILPPWPIPFWKSQWDAFCRHLVLQAFHSEVRRNARNDGYTITWPTHVAGTLGDGEFFEMTKPRGRIGKLAEYNERMVTVCVPLHPFDITTWVENLRELDGEPYDDKELLAFFLSDALKLKLVNRGIIDSYNKYVCSTALSLRGYAPAGFPFPPGREPAAISPAFYLNYPTYFRAERHESARA